VPDWLRRKLWVRFDLERALGREVPILMGAHHRSHAAAAFLLSPFEEAAILTVDGVGEWATASWGVGRGHRFELREETRFPHSLGLLYSAVTSLLGYPINEGEGTIMGLAPYGEPRFRSVLERVAPLDPDGSIRLDPRVFRSPGDGHGCSAAAWSGCSRRVARVKLRSRTSTATSPPRSRRTSRRPC
jgi:carbamoyltransferase